MTVSQTPAAGFFVAPGGRGVLCTVKVRHPFFPARVMFFVSESGVCRNPLRARERSQPVYPMVREISIACAVRYDATLSIRSSVKTLVGPLAEMAAMISPR